MTERTISWGLEGSRAISIHYWLLTLFQAVSGSFFVMILWNILTKIFALFGMLSHLERDNAIIIQGAEENGTLALFS
jgi:hypothetical protein